METYLTQDGSKETLQHQVVAPLTKSNVKVAVTVARGPDWKHGDEDGGNGGLGTIMSIDRRSMTVQVMWQSTGKVFSHYEYGSSMHLSVATSEPMHLSVATSEPMHLSLATSEPVTSMPQGSPQASLFARRSVRRNSQLFFQDPDQTFIVLDWDDTLFPTTYVRDDLDLCWKIPLQDQDLDSDEIEEIGRKLAACADNVVQLLRSATACGKVVLVTLARSPWVTESCKNFFPGVGQLIAELEVPVVYAQEVQKIDTSKLNMSSDEEVELFWSRVKGRAIAEQLREFYSQYEGQSWKNIISIGDSDFERLGTQGAIKDYMKQTGIETLNDMPAEIGGHLYKVRTKTFKMVDQPTIEELTVEIAMLRKWFPLMVKLDRGFDINLNDVTDPGTLARIERTLSNVTDRTGT